MSTIYQMILKVNIIFLLDDTSLFTVVHDIDTLANNLNHDLEKISEWVFQRKIKIIQIPPNKLKK